MAVFSWTQCILDIDVYKIVSKISFHVSAYVSIPCRIPTLTYGPGCNLWEL